MEELFDIALASVKIKFPKEFSNPRYKFEVYDLVEMAANELLHKHMATLIVNPFINSLGKVKEE